MHSCRPQRDIPRACRLKAQSHTDTFRTPVTAVYPNPNWSTVGLPYYKKRVVMGTATTAAAPTNRSRGPALSLQFSRLEFSTLTTHSLTHSITHSLTHSLTYLSQLPNTWFQTVNSLQLPTVVSFDRRTLPRLLFHIPTLVSAIGHFQLLDHGCGTAFRPTYDSLTLPFSSFAGR